MRKLPQDFAFPLGLGTKKQHSLEHPTTNGVLKVSNKILPGSSSSDLSPRAPLSDLDTINLWIFVHYFRYLSLLWINCYYRTSKIFIRLGMDAKREILRHKEFINETMTAKKINQKSMTGPQTKTPSWKPSSIHLNANAFENSRESHKSYYEFAQKLIRSFDVEAFRVFRDFAKHWPKHGFWLNKNIEKRNTFICAFLLESC